LLPLAFSLRLPVPKHRHSLLPRASGLAIVTSLVIGVLTHLVWDAFTHLHSFGVRAIPPLAIYLFSVQDYHVYVYKLLQHGSTVVGAGLLAGWCRNWLLAAPVQTKPWPVTLSAGQRRTVICTLLVVPAAIGLWVATSNLHSIYGIYRAADFVKDTVITAISTGGLLLIAYSLFWHVAFSDTRRPH
jgi:hypothetical protein